MRRSQRRLVASIAILIFLAFWIWAAATIGTMLATAPNWVSLPYFVIAGIGWVIPLRPLMRWMNRGAE